LQETRKKWVMISQHQKVQGREKKSAAAAAAKD
jgi:hypothetical protein